MAGVELTIHGDEDSFARFRAVIDDPGPDEGDGDGFHRFPVRHSPRDGRFIPAGGGATGPATSTPSVAPIGGQAPVVSSRKASEVHRRGLERTARFKDSAGPDYDPEAERAHAGYIREGHRPVNAALRSGDATQLRDRADSITGMDRAFQRSHVTTGRTITVHRGVDEGNPMLSHPAGTELVDHGFTSTSALAEEAAPFGNRRVRITAPAGSHVMAGSAPERELIFPRGTRFRVGPTDRDGTANLEVLETPLPTSASPAAGRLAAELLAFHLSGKHDQKAHGNSKGKGFRNVPGKTGLAKQSADDRAAYDKAKAAKKAKASAAAKKGAATKAAKKAGPPKVGSGGGLKPGGNAGSSGGAAKKAPAMKKKKAAPASKPLPKTAKVPPPSKKAPAKAPAKKAASPTAKKATSPPKEVLEPPKLTSDLPREKGEANDVRKAALKRLNALKPPPPSSVYTVHQSYTASGYVQMNKQLRGQATLTPSQSARIKRMDKSFELAGVQNAEPITVTRRVPAMNYLQNAQPGQEFHEPGFMSTSTRSGGVAGFGSTQLRITAPPGTTMVHGTDYEQELIFPRGQRMRITNIETHGSIPANTSSIIHMEIIPN